jgi:hypothetical protein
VCHVLQDCVHLVNMRGDPANRTALEAELSLAASWYQGAGYCDPPERAEIPDFPQPSFSFSFEDQQAEEAGTTGTIDSNLDQALESIRSGT